MYTNSHTMQLVQLLGLISISVFFFYFRQLVCKKSRKGSDRGADETATKT